MSFLATFRSLRQMPCGLVTIAKNARISPFIWVFLAAMPPAALVVATHKYYLPYPLREGWVMNTPLLEQWYEGTFTIASAFVSEAGYQVFVPLLLQTWLAALTRWNQGHEVAVNVIAGFMIFAAFVLSLRLTASRIGRPYPWWMLVTMSALVFSLNQAVNWNWATQIMTFLSLALSALAFLFLAMDNRWARWVAAPVFGVLSSFSFGSGLLFWPCGLLLLGITEYGEPRAPRWGRLAAWAALSVAVIALWRLTLRGTVMAGQEAPVFERAVMAVRLFPIYLGNGLVRFHLSWSGVAGMAGLVFVCGFAVLARKNKTPLRALALPVSLIIYGAVMGLAIGWKWGPRYAEFIAEHNLGLHDVVSRYPTFANFFWVGLLLLGWVSVCPPDACRRPLAGALLSTLAVAVTLLACVSGRTGYYEADERYRVHTPLVKNNVLNDVETLEKRLEFKGNDGREALRVMRRHRLSIFRPEARAFWEATDCRSNWDWGEG